MGNADVISHFIVWDVFLIKDRIPYFISGQSVPNVPIDVEEMNKGAIKYARSGISKEELLNQFSVTRKQLVDGIGRIPNIFIMTTNLALKSEIKSLLFITHST